MVMQQYFLYQARRWRKRSYWSSRICRVEEDNRLLAEPAGRKMEDNLDGVRGAGF